MGGTEFIKKTMTTYLMSHTRITEDEVIVVMRQFLKVEKAFNGNFLALRLRNAELPGPALSENASIHESQEKGGEYLEETKETVENPGRYAVHLELICHMSTPQLLQESIKAMDRLANGQIMEKPAILASFS